MPDCSHGLQDHSVQETSVLASEVEHQQVCPKLTRKIRSSAALRNEAKFDTFKLRAKEWVKENIAINPIKEPNIIQRNPRRPISNQHQPNIIQQNSFRRYFHPIANP
jgi:hypothetical protein